MSNIVTFPINDAAVTTKAREIQRGLLAEAAGDAEAAERHFLAAAHLEVVLAEDYEANGDHDAGRRSRISAASCFWRAGNRDRARQLFDEAIEVYPDAATEIRSVQDDLEKNCDSSL